MKTEKAGLMVGRKYALAAAVPDNLVPDDGVLHRSALGAVALRTYVVAVAAAKAVVVTRFPDAAFFQSAEPASKFR